MLHPPRQRATAAKVPEPPRSGLPCPAQNPLFLEGDDGVLNVVVVDAGNRLRIFRRDRPMMAFVMKNPGDRSWNVKLPFGID